MQDGAMYEGQFWEDKPHGLGNLIREDGTVYNGIFIKGEIKGSGEKVPNYDDRAKIPRIKDRDRKSVV